MATLPAATNVTILTASDEVEMKNTLTTERKLIEGVPELKKKRAEAKNDFLAQLAKELGAGTANLDSAINKYKIWKTADAGFEERTQAVKDLLKDMRVRIKGFSKPGLKAAFKNVLDRDLRLVEEELKIQGKDTKLLNDLKKEIQGRLKGL